MSEVQSSFKRCEKKYLLTRDQYRIMRLGMAARMKADEYPCYSISNIYYDTEHFDLIRASLEKPVYKEKLRLRSYGVPGSLDPAFLEIKKKYDGVVYKRRITMEMIKTDRYLRGMQAGTGSQISREIDWFMRFHRPVPKVFIAYEREAYATKDGGELRITFDTGLRARSNDVDLRFGDNQAKRLDEQFAMTGC